MENRQRSLVITSIAAVALAATMAAIAMRRESIARRSRADDQVDATKDEPTRQSPSKRKKHGEVSVAFVGNSIIYFNDTPRFLQLLRTGPDTSLDQDSCLCGGASLPSIILKGNGMKKKFHTPNALRSDGTYDVGAPTVRKLLCGDDDIGDAQKVVPPVNCKRWDFVIMNDYTQAPARHDSRQASIDALTQFYVPLFRLSGATPVFLVTAAYREPTKNSDDLGTVEQFTSKLMRGYEAYAEAIGMLLPPSQKPIVSPVGMAYLQVYKENIELWRKLFQEDNFHPSPHGSYLQGCVLHCSIFGELPLRHVALPSVADGGPGILWERAKARVMQPLGVDPLPPPTLEEAEYLWEVAGRVALGLMEQ